MGNERDVRFLLDPSAYDAACNHRVCRMMMLVEVSAERNLDGKPLPDLLICAVLLVSSPSITH